MIKRIFSIIFTIIIVTTVAISPVNSYAYEITSFDITAKSGMLASLDTGEILYNNNIDAKMYPASITKIMTVILILENPSFDQNGRITMTKEVLDKVAGSGSAVSGLKAGEEFSQLDLIYLILMASYGDCAYLAAEYYGGGTDAFVASMNEKAQQLGMTGTHYTNPVGLHDPETYTTVRDTYALTLYALKNEVFKTVCESARYNMPATNMSKARTLSTTNLMQDNTTSYYYQYAKGVKTGYTDEAGRCLVSTASYNGYNYICILFNCPPNAGKRYEFIESANLYRWAFNGFSYKELANSNEPVCEMPVDLSLDTDHVSLYFEKSFISVLPNEADMSTVIIKPHLNAKSVDAPIKKGDILGTAEIVYAEQVVGTVNLVSGTNVKASWLLKTIRTIKNILKSVYMKVLLAIAAIAVFIFIIMCIRLNLNRLRKRKVKYIPYNEGKDKNHYEH